MSARRRRRSPPGARSSSSAIVTDYDEARAAAVVDGLDDRFVGARIDASDAEDVARLARAHGATHVFNAVDPRFVLPVFNGALAAGADYLDMAMSLSAPHPEQPYELTGVKLGDDQFAAAPEWERQGRLALVGIGVEPGLSDVFARYAADELFSEIDELGVRDGANLEVDGYTSRRPSRSGRRSRSASTRRWCGRRAAAGSPRRRSPSRRPSCSPRASGRSSA